MNNQEIGNLKRALESGCPVNDRFSGKYHLLWEDLDLNTPKHVLAHYGRVLDDADQNWEQTSIQAEIPEKIVNASLEELLRTGSSRFEHRANVHYQYEMRTSEGGGDSKDERYETIVKVQMEKTEETTPVQMKDKDGRWTSKFEKVPAVKLYIDFQR